MLQVGDTYAEVFFYTQEQVVAFAELSGDKNPLHLDAAYAASTMFKKPIIHGILGASIMSKILGMHFPGEGTVYLKQEIDFKRPMYVDTQYEAQLKVLEINADKHIAIVETKIVDKETGKVNVLGNAHVMHKRKNMKFDKQSLKLALIFKGAIVKRLLAGMLVLISITIVLVYIHNNNADEYKKLNMTISGALPGYMGAALGLLLVFRNSTAYDKWWEARKEVGALVNTARNLAITLNGLLPFNTPERKEVSNLLIAFVFNLKAHLRDQTEKKTLDILSKEDRALVENAKHKPVVIANIMTNKIENVWKRNLITDIQQSLLIEKIHGLIDILGKCERIKNTPIPMAYMYLLKFLINLYVIILPFSLVDEIGWLCVPLVILLYYILMSIVITAEEIEEPFGYDLNDLEMDKIAMNIKNNIDEIVTHD